MKFYKKARSAGTVLHKEECDLLTAALYAESGDIEKAEKVFSKVDESMLRGDFESLAYLATYYAAVGDAAGAAEAVSDAYKINPGRTLSWLEVGDDFYSVKSSPEFSAMLTSLKKSASKELTLKLPPAKQPKLEVNDTTGLFVAQQELPKYKLKKRKPLVKDDGKVLAKKKAVKKSKKSAKKQPAAKSSSKTSTTSMATEGTPKSSASSKPATTKPKSEKPKKQTTVKKK